MIGRWFGDFLPPDYYERFPERFASPNDTGEVCNLDFEMVRKDGAQITVSFYGRVTVDDQGRFKGTHCTFQDMTARKQAERDSAGHRGAFAAEAGTSFSRRIPISSKRI